MRIKLGVIGGSGLYNIEGVKVIDEVDIPTPFGMTSDLISIVDIDGIDVAFLPRHGKGHRLLPTEVPSRANIWALKSLGVSQILTISAVGSLQEEIKPGDFVVCDQIIDRTRSRSNSYFGDGIVGHVPFAEPFCSRMRKELISVLKKTQCSFHKTGTLLTMEGPLFSTKAESLVYKQWGAHIIGMTALPEAKLAREAEICFTLLAMVTDYDCWRPAEESVTVDMVMERMRGNIDAFREVLPSIIKIFHKREECECHQSAQFAMMTDKDIIPYEVKRKLKLFYNKYWKE
ncbi:MAG: S-methyl-5'-thioadenosine phosphorylase [Spirochaetales bacterium]|nr:S-methyl-5'-thioadenosine phosphorylase [Spirochaetales bacterium]